MQKRKTIAFISLCLMILFYNALFAETANYCQDQESWKEWDAFIEKNLMIQRFMHSMH